MLDYLLFLVLCTVTQAGILHLWLDSYLFSKVQKRLVQWRDGESRWRLLAYLFTCWQCFGVWVGWIVVFTFTLALPGTPIPPWDVPVIFLLGIATGLLSELLEFYVLSHISGYSQND